MGRDPVFLVVVLSVAACAGITACGDEGLVDPVDSCEGYPDWETSLYVLPYPVGEGYQVVQANCSSPSAYWNSHQAGTPWTYAYDFLMPVGSEIAAARGGVVAFVRENFTDNDKGLDQGNVIVVDHGDGTYAGYGHLTHLGALAEQGEQIEQGEVIGLSGNSGASPIPHLHFQVSNCLQADTCESLPITFRNAEANPTGLILDREYVAREWD